MATQTLEQVGTSVAIETVPTGTDLIELYYDRGWSDGLPVVPPTQEKVDAIVAALGGDPQFVECKVAPRWGALTREILAVNMVMAGCRPEYMPVVVAAIKSLCAPAFAYHGPASSTGGSAMALVVNGPIAQRLGINSGNNAFGQGHRPNATIGRAVRLIMMNVMNTRPGLLDRATLGNPGKYSFCFAENEEDHPWEPLHVARGLRREDSAVTLIASNSLYQVYNHLAADPEPLLLCFADALGNVGTPNLLGFNETLIVFAGEHAEVLQKAGWSRLDVQRFLIERTRRSVADYKRGARLPGAVTEGDETTWRYRFERPEDILIAFAGGRAGSWSACLPGWGTKWTRSVTTRIDPSQGGTT